MEELHKKLLKNLNNFQINIRAKSLEDVNLKELNKEILYLKSKKSINNTEYELLKSVKGHIESIQSFKDDSSYKQLDESISYLENYSLNSTDAKSENFKKIIQNLSSSSKESIVNSEEFNKFNKYLHIHRPIENKLINELKELQHKNKGIILLVGSVGDGKSHLLAYLKNYYHEMFNNIEIYNDATESNDPYKTAVETLSEKISEYNNSENKKLVLAINIGMLHNFASYLKNNNNSSAITDIIKESHIFSSEGMDNSVYRGNENITIVSFLNELPFVIEDGDLISDFYNKIMKKIFDETEHNPFYQNFLKDDGFSRKEAVYQNYKLLLNKDIQETIKKLLIKIQIENKRILTTRSLLNFIHDIIVPDDTINENDSLLVNLLFENKEKSPLLSALSTQDPVMVQNPKLDELNIEIYNSLNIYNKCKEIFGEDHFKYINEYLYLLDGLSHRRKFQVIVRLHYLFNFNMYSSEDFLEFIKILDEIDSSIKYKKSVSQKVINATYLWNGSPEPGYIYSENLKSDLKIRMGLEFEPKLKNIMSTEKNTIIVLFNIQGEDYNIEIDYNLFKLLNKLEKGYVLKEKDKAEAIVFAEFIDKILNNLESKNSTIINLTEDNINYIVKKNFFGYEIGRL